MADELFRGYERVGFKTQKGILPDVEVYERGNSFFRVVSSIHGEKKWKPIHGAFTGGGAQLDHHRTWCL